MNYIYRIKITERNNGTKVYTPQVGVPVSKVLKWLGVSESWLNIIEENGSFTELETISHVFKLESKALEVVERYKQYQQNKQGEQTKEITYKQV